jgi:hypothetical protein
MYCPKCGTQFLQDAAFCHKCGTPVGQTIREADEPKWEYCEIVYNRKESLISGTDFYFWAKAVGPNGQYAAGESPHANYWFGPGFPESSNSRHAQIHVQLIEKLVRDGWEPVADRGVEWFQLRFRRKVKGQVNSVEEYATE